MRKGETAREKEGERASQGEGEREKERYREKEREKEREILLFSCDRFPKLCFLWLYAVVFC